VTHQAADPHARAAEAEEALRQALAERNRLWAELGKRRATEEELAYWRRRAQDIERSRWWRAGRPLRLLKRFSADPVAALEVAVHVLRERRRS